MRRTAVVGMLGLTGLTLIYLLISRSALTLTAFAQSIGCVIGWPLACVIALIGLNLALGTVKWLSVASAAAPGCRTHSRFIDAMLATTLGVTMGQVMPVQIGVALARSLAARLSVGQSFMLNFGTTAYEQLFDFVLLCAAGIIGFAGVLLRPRPVGWLLLIVIAGAIAITGSLGLPLLLRVTSALLDRTLNARGLGRRMPIFLSGIDRVTELPRSLVVRLAVLSILRYATNLFRIAIVLGALGMISYSGVAALAFPLIQTVGLLPVTPGNLGVMEFTWSAVLVSGGATIHAAALFALITRAVNLISLGTLLLVLGTCRLSEWFIKTLFQARP